MIEHGEKINKESRKDLACTQVEGQISKSGLGLINNFLQNFRQIRSFYEMSKNKTEWDFKMILLMMKKCQISINMSKPLFLISVTVFSEKDREDITKDLEFSFFEKIGKCIQMKTFLNEQVYEKKEKINGAKFREFVEDLGDLICYCGKLKNTGYRFKSEFLTFTIEKLNYDNFLDQKKELQETYDDYQKTVKDAFENCYLMTFLHEGMIYKFVNILIKNDSLNFEAVNLCEYLGLDLTTELRNHFRNTTKCIKHSDQVSILTEFLKEKQTQLKIKRTNNSNDKIQTFDSKIIYMIELNDKKTRIYEKLLQKSTEILDQFPQHFNILFCNEKTKVFEVLAFLYRVFTCENNEAFFLVNPDTLTYENQQEIIEIHNSIIEKYKTKKASFFIFYTSRNSNLITYFRQSQIVKKSIEKENEIQLRFEKLMHPIQNRVKLVTSEQSLSGKSYFIRSEVKKKEKTYYNIKFTGTIETSQLYLNFLKVPVRENVCYHFEVSQINKSSQKKLEEILFSIIFLGVFKHEFSVIVFPKSSFFYIEFDSSEFEKIQTKIEFITSPKFQFLTVNHLETLENMMPLTPITYCFWSNFKNEKIENYSVSELEKHYQKKENIKQRIIMKRNIGLNENEFSFEFEQKYSLENVQKYNDWIKEQFKNDKQELSKYKRLMFEKIVHFLADGFANCADFIYEKKASEKRKFMAEMIVITALNLTKLTYKTFKLEQDKQIENKHSSGVSFPVNQKSEKDSWENFSSFMVLFAENFPVYIYKDSFDIPKRITEIAKTKTCLKDYSKMNHEEFFLYLCHMNSKIGNCLFF